MTVYIVVVTLQEGFTSLAFAAQNGHAHVVKALLEGNADPNIVENVRFNFCSQIKSYVVLP